VKENLRQLGRDHLVANLDAGALRLSTEELATLS
jgi:hypothetical protein